MTCWCTDFKEETHFGDVVYFPFYGIKSPGFSFALLAVAACKQNTCFVSCTKNVRNSVFGGPVFVGLYLKK